MPQPRCFQCLPGDEYWSSETLYEGPLANYPDGGGNDDIPYWLVTIPERLIPDFHESLTELHFLQSLAIATCVCGKHKALHRTFSFAYTPSALQLQCTHWQFEKTQRAIRCFTYNFTCIFLNQISQFWSHSEWKEVWRAISAGFPAVQCHSCGNQFDFHDFDLPICPWLS